MTAFLENDDPGETQQRLRSVFVRVMSHLLQTGNFQFDIQDEYHHPTMRAPLRATEQALQLFRICRVTSSST